jgi:hypothetical protein
MEDGAVWLDGGGRGRNQRCYASANIHFGKSMVEFTSIPTTLSETEQTPLYWAWGYSNLQHGPASHRNSRPRGTYPLQSIYKPRHYINTAPSDRSSRNKPQGSHRLRCAVVLQARSGLSVVVRLGLEMAGSCSYIFS